MTHEEAMNALYIDFEGNKDKQPTLLGYCEDEQHTVFLIEDSFSILERPVRGFGSCKRTYVDSMDSALEAICERAREEDRLIVSFSQHELNMFSKYSSDQTLLDEFRSAYRDGKAVLRHRTRNDPNRLMHRGRTLANYCALYGLPEPSAPSRGLGQALRDLRKRLEKTTRWKGLHQRWRDLATEVIAYNGEDCARLRDLVLLATDDG